MADGAPEPSASHQLPASPPDHTSPATGDTLLPPCPSLRDDPLQPLQHDGPRLRSHRRRHLFLQFPRPLTHPVRSLAAYFKTFLRDARDLCSEPPPRRWNPVPVHGASALTSRDQGAAALDGTTETGFRPDDFDDRKKLLNDSDDEPEGTAGLIAGDGSAGPGFVDDELGGVTCPGAGATCCSSNGNRMASVTPVALMWSLLSILVVGACGVSLFHPYWIMHPDRLHSFGLFTYCARDMASPLPQAVCQGYGEGAAGKLELTRVPAGAWQASTLLFGGGVALEAVGAVVTLVLLVVPSYGRHRLALVNGYLQTVAVLIMLAGLLMFPLGFSTPFFQYYCESTRVFCVGHCRMGWSYVLAITGTALAIFCPVLSNYTDMTFEKEKDRGDREPRTLIATV